MNACDSLLGFVLSSSILPLLSLDSCLNRCIGGHWPISYAERSLNVYQLGPCHSFPGYSYLHAPRHNVKLFFPDCSPELVLKSSPIRVTPYCCILCRHKLSNSTQSEAFENDSVSFYRDIQCDDTDDDSKQDANDLESLETCDQSESPYQHFKCWDRPDIILTYDSYPMLSDNLMKDGFELVWPRTYVAISI